MPDSIPLNELYKLQLTVSDKTDRSRLLSSAEVTVSAVMPEHNHGMNLVPEVAVGEDGHFEVRGMLFHMTGHWVIQVEVSHEGERQQASFDVILE